MRPSSTTPLAGLIFLVASSALAQTTAPNPAPQHHTGSGSADWWWLLGVAVLAIAAIWYYNVRRTRV
jgi:drug/metabolite transporter (DMT)-like permease